MLSTDRGNADPSVGVKTALDAKVEQRSDTVIAVEDFDASGRKCKCNRCAETTCRQNMGFVPGSAPPTRLGIPTDRCPNILGQIADDEVDVLTRYWVKKTFVEKKRLPFPRQLREIAEREGVKDSMPLSAVETILDALEWPSITLDEGRKKPLADFVRQLTDHAAGAKQISYVRWGTWVRHNVKLTGGALLRRPG